MLSRLLNKINNNYFKTTSLRRANATVARQRIDNILNGRPPNQIAAMGPRLLGKVHDLDRVGVKGNGASHGLQIAILAVAGVLGAFTATHTHTYIHTPPAP